MYLHLGQDTVVKEEKIVGIFDLETATVSGITRDYLKIKQKNDDIINVSMEMPKSFIPCTFNNKTKVYISQISSTTLLKRTKLNPSERY